ncbi:hypothetical protein BYT27DRAFT_6440520 [Phlegmacium glaucopus]|nr:hypothetical protein BYT27DRAFT_6440520 [Phlegmacium glaucopus]
MDDIESHGPMTTIHTHGVDIFLVILIFKKICSVISSVLIFCKRGGREKWEFSVDQTKRYPQRLTSRRSKRSKRLSFYFVTSIG